MDAKTTRRFLAIDLGAESGRGMLATLEGGSIRLEEVHRFPNEPVRILDTLHWDVPRLFLEIKRAIAAAAGLCRERRGQLDGIGVDTWGVDYGLIGPAGDLLGLPVHYRDRRTEGVQERVFERVSREEIFEATGLQFLGLNTLYQLVAERERDPGRLARTRCLLFMPDLFHYFLTGRLVSERTIASTSQLWDPRRNAWSDTLLERLGLPATMFPTVLVPGSVVGSLRDDLCTELRLDSAPPPVIAGACHDTGAAVAATPVDDSDYRDEGRDAGDRTWAYLSSGTWSLMGVELREPRVTPDVLAENFTNEGGVDGTVRFLRNLMGLWLLQETRRTWEREGTALSYEEMTDLASRAAPLRSLVAADSAEFFAPGDMPERIRNACRRSDQPIPESPGEILRCILESLALSYRDAAKRISRLTGKSIDRLHIVGGGSKNHLLDQMTADALGVDVVAGPSEATALGNALMQALATGAISSIRELRAVVRNSVETTSFVGDVSSRPDWDSAYERFTDLPREAI